MEGQSPDSPIGVSPERLRVIRVGVTVVASWVLATDDQSDGLLRAARRDDPEALLVGLSFVARLLTWELSFAIGRAGHKVLADVWWTVSREPRRTGAPNSQRQVTGIRS
jgi:hypothetical protein